MNRASRNSSTSRRDVAPGGTPRTRHARAAPASLSGPHADGGTAPSQGIARTEAALEVWTATWSSHVRRQPRTAIPTGPSAPSPVERAGRGLGPRARLCGRGRASGGRRT
jgi:hypothetical protein